MSQRVVCLLQDNFFEPSASPRLPSSGDCPRARPWSLFSPPARHRPRPDVVLTKNGRHGVASPCQMNEIAPLRAALRHFDFPHVCRGSQCLQNLKKLQNTQGGLRLKGASAPMCPVGQPSAQKRGKSQPDLCFPLRAFAAASAYKAIQEKSKGVARKPQEVQCFVQRRKAAQAA